MPVTDMCDWKRLLYELLHGKIIKTIYIPSEDSDQNKHPQSLIRIIPVHSMGGKDQNFLHDSGQTVLI